ncbi:MAG: phosphoribosylamine--glycine ligase [Chitinivibrionales bacterium]|nr:phosphoribosylamine--glycine ligase [Chitinivibrionales bacterium]
MDTVLIVGSGGREHALLKALLRTDRPLCTFASPGNPGLEADGCMLVEPSVQSWEELAVWAEQNEVDLTVVGPEVPLVEGIVDTFAAHGLCAFGPSAKAARIEGSKAFSKQLMKRYNIPTAAFETFDTKNAAVAYVKKHGAPVVVKADGLAAGKGAIVCDTEADALAALEGIFDRKQFGAAGETVVIEEKMTGEEASVFVLTDGTGYRILPVAQDHKPIGEGDSGPNTGGMGAYAPAPLVDDALLARIEKEIIVPTLRAMREEDSTYRGLLYCGVMITEDGPKVVEYNCRFGDPETQAVLPLVSCDWFEVLRACAVGGIEKVAMEVKAGACATVVMASAGYPGSYEKGKVITGIEQAEDEINVDVYHAGTRLDREGRLVTNGGRVLAVSAWEDSLEQAIGTAYLAVDKIDFEGKYCRRDIGAKGVARLRTKRT